MSSFSARPRKPGVAGYVTLVHEDAAVLDNDRRWLRALEREALYEPDGSAEAARAGATVS
jgi:hypothetical protein